MYMETSIWQKLNIAIFLEFKYCYAAFIIYSMKTTRIYLYIYKNRIIATKYLLIQKISYLLMYQARNILKWEG